MTKLITAEEARNMSADIMDDFINNGMEPYIEYLNKNIEEAIKKGRSGVQFWYRWYCEVTPDPILSELSEEHLGILMEHLKSNGYYVKLTCNKLLYIAWWEIEEKPVKEEPKKKSLWDRILWDRIWGDMG